MSRISDLVNDTVTQEVVSSIRGKRGRDLDYDAIDRSLATTAETPAVVANLPAVANTKTEISVAVKAAEEKKGEVVTPTSTDLTAFLDTHQPTSQPRVQGSMIYDPETVQNMSIIFTAMRVAEKQAQPMMDSFVLYWQAHRSVYPNSDGQAIAYYVEHRRVAKTPFVKWSSCRIYSINLRNALVRRRETDGHRFVGYSDYNRWIYYVEINAVAEQTTHAADVNDKWVKGLLDGLKKDADYNLRCLIVVMCVAGTRHQDLTGVVGIYLSQEPKKGKRLHIDYGRTKTVTKQSERQSRIYPVSSMLSEYLPDVNGTDRQAISMTNMKNATDGKLKTLNKVLEGHPIPDDKKSSEDASRRGKTKATSYSLRRYAIGKIAESFTVDGETDWSKVAHMTGHLNENIPRSVYCKTACEVAQDLLVLTDEDEDGDL